MKNKFQIPTVVATLLIGMNSPLFSQEEKPLHHSPTEAHTAADVSPDAAKKAERPMQRALREAQGPIEELRRRAMAEKSAPPTEAKPWRIGLAVEPVDATLRAHLGLPEDAGVIVTEIMEKGPAANAGIAKNDIIVNANGRNVANLEQLRDIVAATSNNAHGLRLQVIHQGKRGDVFIKQEMTKPDSAAGQAGPRPMTMTDPLTNRMAQQNMQMERRMMKLQEEVESLRKLVYELKSAMKQENTRDDKKAE
jgi:membrane-associated protease RseP (regulator of RpoE activity)